MKNESSRREFLKKSLLTAGATGLAMSSLSTKAQAEAKKKYNMLEESDPQAKALGYFKDAAKADTKKFPKRATPEAKKTQFCNTCALYKKVEGTGKDEVGTCTLFMAPKLRHVKGLGWCNSWVARPAK